MRRILKFISSLSFLNWLFIGCIIFLMVKDCVRVYKDKQKAKVQVTSVSPVSEVIKEAEKIKEEVDTAGRLKVIYRLSNPIIEKIVDNKKLDSIAVIAGARAERISSITQINGQLNKENTDLKRKVASLASGGKDTSWVYTDKWLTLDGFKPNDTVFRIKHLVADASISDIRYDYKKSWLFGRNESRATVYFESPYIKVKGMNTATFRQPEPKFKVDVNIEGKYLHNQKEVLIGPKIRVGVGRLGLSGGYYLNPAGTIGNGLWYGADWKIY